MHFSFNFCIKQSNKKQYAQMLGKLCSKPIHAIGYRIEKRIEIFVNWLTFSTFLLTTYSKRLEIRT